MAVPVVTAAFKEASRTLPRHSICGLTVCKVQVASRGAVKMPAHSTPIARLYSTSFTIST